MQALRVDGSIRTTRQMASHSLGTGTMRNCASSRLPQRDACLVSCYAYTELPGKMRVAARVPAAIAHVRSTQADQTTTASRADPDTKKMLSTTTEGGTHQHR